MNRFSHPFRQKNNLGSAFKVTGHSITQSLNNCARGLIPWIHIWQWLKREKMSTISSYMFAASVFEGHVLGRTDSTILIDRRTTWAVHKIASKWVQGHIERFSSFDIHERQANKKQLQCDLPMAALKYKTLSDRLVPSCFRKKHLTWAHMSLSIGLPTRQKLTQQSEKFAHICRQIEASYVLLSFVHRRDSRKAT